MFRSVTLAMAFALASPLLGCTAAEYQEPDGGLADDAGEPDGGGRVDAAGGDDAGAPPDAAGPRADAPPTGCLDNDGDGFGVGPDCAGPDCDDFRLEAHPGGTETCNGQDDDCDTETDEDLGSSTCGVGACARTVERCAGGAPQTCTPGTPGVETCNGADDDCDTQTDEDLGSLSCGAGPCARTVAACVGGAPGTCVPGAPGTETCNGIDDDCDTVVDDGVCGPPNDALAGAVDIALGAAEVTVAGTTAGATHDGPSVPCSCTSGADVWYRLTLPAAGAIYLDTSGSGFDTSLVVTDASGAPVAAQAGNGRADAGLCNDDSGCDTTGGFTYWAESRTWGWLPLGVYHVVVGGCAEGSFVLRAQYVASGSASYVYSGRLEGDSTRATVLVGTSAATSATCGGTASGEDAYWFTTCGASQFFSLCRSDSPAPAWQRSEDSSGGTLYDPALYVRSAGTGGEVACNDDGLSTGATDCRGYYGADEASLLDSLHWGARLAAVAAPRGLNVVFVDGRITGSGMNYRLRYTVRDR